MDSEVTSGHPQGTGGRCVTEDYYFLSNRVSNLERHVEILIDRFEETSPTIKEIQQNTH